jgi:large subunit ribosomal protein L25
MERLQLKAVTRNESGKGPARRLRSKGLVPAIIYGKACEPTLLAIDTKELNRSLMQAGGTNVLFDLQIDGKKSVPVMVRDYQAHVIERNLIHVDFLQVDLTEKIHVEIPIRLIGKPPGLKEGGILEHIRRTLEVICLPTAIPEFIEADVSALNIGDTVHVHDLKLPEGIELAAITDVAIAAVVAPAEEKIEEVVAVEGAPTEPEVIGAKKKEEEEGEGEEAPKKEEKEKKKKEKEDKK